MDRTTEKIIRQIKKLNNDCIFCSNCVKQYVKFNGELHLVENSMRCVCKEMTANEIKARMNNEIACEHFKLLSLPESTDLDNIAYALSGIMSELYEIKLILKKRKSKTEKTSDRTN